MQDTIMKTRTSREEEEEEKEEAQMKPSSSIKRKREEEEENVDRSRKRSISSDDDEEDESSEEEKEIDVPDPDVYNFDDTMRKLGDIKEGEVWAVYDEINAMPRLYAFVNKIDKKKKGKGKSKAKSTSVKAQVTWLDAVGNSHNEDWIEVGFHQVVGEFKLGDKATIDIPNCLSHKVTHSVEKGVYKVYPRKGEAWAVYKEWSNQWIREGMNPKHVGFCMVEVVSDFMEGVGVVVGPLTKIEGVETVYQKHPSILGLVKWHELSKFSHFVPSMPLLELDPSATTVAPPYKK